MGRAATVETPQKGSELELDDQVWPHHPLSELARISLIAATEHLQLAGEIVGSKHLHVTADFTVLRGGLVGGATAVWLLGPDDPVERQQRGLRHVVEWYRRKRQYDEAMRPFCPDVDRSRLEAQINHTEQRRVEARGKWVRTPTLTEAESPSDSKRIEWSASFAFHNDQQLVDAIKSLWSAMSGDAHALGWQLISRRSGAMTSDGSGLATMIASASIESLAEPYLGAYKLVKRGWSLFDQRCTGD